jgi:glutamyl-tRNA reductase
MTIRTMLREGVRDIRIANRTFSRAASLAEHTGTVAIPLEQVGEALREADIVICATASPLISRALCPLQALAPGTPKVLVDIGVPRNVDPSVRDVPGVTVFDMDDLLTVCPASPEDRHQDLANAEAILEAEISRFMSWWRSAHAVPTIAALEDAVEDARRRELAKTLRRMPSFDDSQREALEALTKALVKKVLHQPITRLKLHGDDDAFIALGRELFGLESREHGRNGRRSAVNGRVAATPK